MWTINSWVFRPSLLLEKSIIRIIIKKKSVTKAIISLRVCVVFLRLKNQSFIISSAQNYAIRGKVDLKTFPGPEKFSEYTCLKTFLQIQITFSALVISSRKNSLHPFRLAQTL